MIEYKYVKTNNKSLLLSIISKLIVNVIVLLIVNNLFKGFYIENLFYIFIVSILLLIFNKLIKPILILIMLPINILTLGITYPLVNVIILKLISLIIGDKFILGGWFIVFFISIFISIMTFVIDRLIGREIRR